MKLTELEGAALGLLWLRGSATAYELRKMVAESPTPQWSASAGTVYPLVRKLCRARLIAFATTGDKRGTRQLRITLLGRRAFKNWMVDCSPTVIGLPPDPVRTRLRFLELVSSSEASGLFERFEKHMRSQLTRMRTVRRGARTEESLSESLTSLGARLSQESRIEWITAAKRLARRSRAVSRRVSK
jgi:DNA-binding PadR family transcriptional regulator